MNVTIETFFSPYCDEATEIYLRLVNTILLQTTKTACKRHREAKNPSAYRRLFRVRFRCTSSVGTPTQDKRPDRIFQVPTDEGRILTSKRYDNENGNDSKRCVVFQTREECHEYFTLFLSPRRKKRLRQYDYRHTDGELLSCVIPTLEECRAIRDIWLNNRNNK